MIGAYNTVKAFAYPGWRLTVPGGPAGGHSKGFTHTQAAGTDLLPQDQYEQDREDGMSSHDAATSTFNNPRGIYRSSAEVPPRPNASGQAHTYRGFQDKRGAGDSIAPGSFPASFFTTAEDAFLSAIGLGELAQLGAVYLPAGMIPPPGMPISYWGSMPPIARPSPRPIIIVGADGAPATGATNVVTQPSPTPVPLPPAQSIPVAVAPPVSPTPGPIVATNEVVPLNDGSGNYVNISTGAIVSAATVMQNPATMQLTTSATAFGQLVPAADGSGNFVNPQTGAVIPASAVNAAAANTLTIPSAANAFTWLEQPSSLFPSIPNWGMIAGTSVLLMMLFGASKGKR